MTEELMPTSTETLLEAHGGPTGHFVLVCRVCVPNLSEYDHIEALILQSTVYYDNELTVI